VPWFACALLGNLSFPPQAWSCHVARARAHMSSPPLMSEGAKRQRLESRNLGERVNLDLELGLVR